MIILKVIDRINDTVGKAVSFLLPIIFTLLTIEVIMRYVFDAPTLWIGELTTLLFGAYFILAGGFVMMLKGHVAMDVVYNALSKRTRAVLDIITFFIAITFAFAIISKGGDRALDALSIFERSTSIWAPQIWWAKLCLPIGGILLALQMIAKFIRDIYILVKGEDYIGR